MMKQETNLKNTSINKLRTAAKAYESAKEVKKKLYENKEWYTIRAVLGNQ